MNHPASVIPIHPPNTPGWCQAVILIWFRLDPEAQAIILNIIRSDRREIR
jgi:hypothetical protein